MSKMNQLIEAMIDVYLESETDVQKVIEDVKKDITSKHGFEVAVSKSTLGGGEPSFFLKVFGPKSTWKNNIALNSPLHMTIRIDGGKIEMTNNSYQIRNHSAKMRATKFSSESDLKKKLLDYFSKNATKFKEIIDAEMKESLDESDYKVMHKTFTDAANAAKEKAEKAGYTFDDDEWFRKVSSGPRKPGRDKTNRYTIELLTKRGNDAKKALHFQIYNTGNSYELNAYIN